jgi:hypothetical protein
MWAPDLCIRRYMYFSPSPGCMYILMGSLLFSMEPSQIETSGAQTSSMLMPTSYFLKALVYIVDHTTPICVAANSALISRLYNPALPLSPSSDVLHHTWLAGFSYSSMYSPYILYVPRLYRMYTLLNSLPSPMLEWFGFVQTSKEYMIAQLAISFDR